MRVTPHRSLQVTGALENSGVAVRACTMPPASMIRCTNTAVLSATWSRSATEPRVLRCPAIGASSLTATGSPFERAGFAGRVALFCFARLVECRLVEHSRERVDLRLDGVGARDHGCHEFDRRQIAARANSRTASIADR